MNWIKLFILGLATFRVATLVSNDSGPWRFLAKFRSFLKREEKTNKVLRKSDIAHGVECLRCSSLELAIPIALFAYYHDQLWPWLATIGDIFLLAMALSAAAILINRALPPTNL